MSQTPQVHPHEAKLKTKDGEWKFTNGLSHQTSPYLLQHAHNPVDWHPWGTKAFELSRRTGKPIFLSIGYSSCYWCHVMERLVFENPVIAAQMNEQLVCVKVDREERPDIDDIYMTATMVFTGRGGWPMSVFLTPPGARGEGDPGLKPFYAGTYFPPEPAHNMPGFPQLIEFISGIWQNQRDEVLDHADQLANMVIANLSRHDQVGPVGPEMVEEVVDQLRRSYDPDHGGFSSAPKFPQPSNLLFLLQFYAHKPNSDMFESLAHTLDEMARGGIYDQIGGGFHRYSTDAKWLVPHFEKMLYDNGQLVEVYTIAHTLNMNSKDPRFYERVVRQTCDYVLRQMTDATGTFWSAQDAEVDAREGGSYVWTEAEFVMSLRGSDTVDLSPLAKAMYGMAKGTNFRDPHDPVSAPANVLYLPKPLAELAAEQSTTLMELLSKKATIDVALLATRDRRKQPMTDDKVLVSWNGLMIGGMAMAGRVFNEQRYVKAAERSANYILEHMRDDEGGLYRTMRKGSVKIPAFLEDYAMFSHGLLELYRTDHNHRWLDAVEKLLAVVDQRFAAPGGGYYDTLANQADLFVRTRNSNDGAISSGNSQIILNLLDLHELTGKSEYLDKAMTDLESFGLTMKRAGASMVHMHHGLLRALQADPDQVAHSGSTVPVSHHEGLTIKVEPTEIHLAGRDATVSVTLSISPQYHINSHEPGIDKLIKTELKIESPGDLVMDVRYPPGLDRTYTFFDQAINIYEGTITMVGTIRRHGMLTDPKDTHPRLMLYYQMCTDRSCLAPQKVALPVSFRVGK